MVHAFLVLLVAPLRPSTGDDPSPGASWRLRLVSRVWSWSGGSPTDFTG